jgi:peroxiredoxin
VVVYRGHWCSHCRDQLLDLSHQADAIRSLGFHLVALSADDFVGANDMRMDTSDAIDVLSDPEAIAITLLGLADRDENVNHIIARPAVFVVDDVGIVRYRYVSRSASDRPTAALLLLAVESLIRPRPKESLTV